MLSSVTPPVNPKWEIKEFPTPQLGVNQVLIKIYDMPFYSIACF
jgi:hypothetical protein